MNLLDIFFPKRCLECGRIGKYFCDVCRREIRITQPAESTCPICEKLAIDGETHPRCRTRYSLDGLTYFFHYDGIIRKAVKALKYRLVTDLANEFVSLTPSIVLDCEVLIPIPLHHTRFKERGFNQAEVLGAVLARRLNIPMYTGGLRRIKATEPQASIKTRKERLLQMKNVFEAVSTVQNKNILLFDDVFTTGATMRSAGSELKRSGAKRVWAVTMAR